MRPGMSEALAHADALLWLAQAQETRPAREASWASYGGGEAIILTIVLLVAAGFFAFAGKRLRAPIQIMRPGGTAAGFMIAIWLLTICDVLVATFVYGLQVKQAYPDFAPPR